MTEGSNGRTHCWQWLTLIAVSALLFFTNLGATELWDEDEPIFAGAAREMMDRGEWVVPYFNRAMLPDKPALLYWVMIGCYRLFGVNEFAARCGPALFGVATVALTWLFGRRLFSASVGFWAGIVLATTLNFNVVARAATPDALLVFFSALAVFCYACGTDTLRPRREDEPNDATSRLAMAAAYMAMGLGVLAKGPLGILLPSATIGLFILTSLSSAATDFRPSNGAKWRPAAKAIRLALAPRRVLEVIRRMYPLTGLVILVAVAGPWYSAVGLRTEGAWLAGFFGKHNFGRFLHPMEHHSGPFFYYLIAIVVGFFPWSLFFGPCAAYVRSRLAERGHCNESYRLLLCWLITHVVFFSLAATKLPSYIVPVYPALALLVGACLDAWVSGEYALPPKLLRTAWLSLLLVGVACAITLPLVAQRFLGGESLLGLAGLPLILGGALCWWWHRLARPRRKAIAFAATAVAFSLAIFVGGAAEVDRYQTSARFAQTVHRQTGDEPIIFRSFGYWRPSLVFYLRQPVQQFFAEDDIRTFCQGWPDRGFLLTTSDRYETIAPWLPPDVRVLERKRWFLRSQELVLLGREEAVLASKESVAWHRLPQP